MFMMKQHFSFPALAVLNRLKQRTRCVAKLIAFAIDMIQDVMIAMRAKHLVLRVTGY
jgi:hypothetical protein